MKFYLEGVTWAESEERPEIVKPNIVETAMRHEAGNDLLLEEWMIINAHKMFIGLPSSPLASLKPCKWCV